MSDRLSEKSLMEFSSLLSSQAAVPGGGGAAALCGALGVSLCAMAGRLSIKGRSERIEPILTRAEALRLKLLALIDTDAEGFAPLAGAYALPKDAPDRAQTLRQATLAACAAPLDMAACCCEATALLVEMLPLCKKLLLSDLGCAAAICRAALEAAAMNVLVNTRSLPDDEEALSIARSCEGLLSEGRGRAEAVFEAVMAVLREE